MTQKLLVIDMETNAIGSMRPPQQTITQFGWILFDEKGNTLQQANNIVLGAKQINRVYANSLTLDEIKQKGIPLQNAFDNMCQYIDSETIIYAHNADFDIGLLKYAGLNLPEVKIVCTMKNSINFCRLPKTGHAAKYPGFKFPKLSELANKLDIEVNTNNLHDALYDCQVTKSCVIKGREIGLF